MSDNLFDVVNFGVLGYVFMCLGIAVGTVIAVAIIKHIKPRQGKKIENIIMDTYIQPAPEKKEDPYADLDIVPSEIAEQDIIIDTEEPVLNPSPVIQHADLTPIPLSEIQSYIEEQPISNVVSQRRKQEDNSYGIIKRRLNQK